MIIREEHLIIVNSKNKIRHIKLSLQQDIINKVFTIDRLTGQYGCKEIQQPIITVDKGKIKRTAAEQATLQYNSLLKSYLDKGYIKISALTTKDYKDLTEEDLHQFLGSTVVSNQIGVPKPMLAKQADQCSSDIWEKDWLCSRKLDGVRCLMYYKDGEIHTTSRGGGTYDVATTHLRNNPELLKIFNLKPDLILDGELYHHGTDWPLQRLSGLARQQEWKEECGTLEYWIYDYIDLDLPFKDRLLYLQQLQNIFSDSNIKIVDHVLLSGYFNIKKEHDKYVQEGFEGLCARNPEKEYGVNKRSSVYLVKLKEYKDDEFKVTGVKEGLRDEDMCFTLVTKDGKEFSAKPMGDADTRKYYLEHYQEYIGRMATCKFFYYSKDGTPLQPIFKHFRPIDE